MQFNISFKTIFEYILKKLVLCIQIRFVSTEKTTRIASRASCFILNVDGAMHFNYSHKYNTNSAKRFICYELDIIRNITYNYVSWPVFGP